MVSNDTSTVLSIKEAVINEFGTSSPMVDVVRCESQYRQFDSDGTVLRGRVDNEDIGAAQINEHYQGKQAKDLGYDIYTLSGNLDYAKYLYSKEGLAPWMASEPCWNS